MVGNQNRAARLAAARASLGGQGMVGNQNGREVAMAPDFV